MLCSNKRDSKQQQAAASSSKQQQAAAVRKKATIRIGIGKESSAGNSKDNSSSAVDGSREGCGCCLAPTI